MHPLLAIFGYSEAAMYLRGPNGANVQAVLSIHGAREFGVDANVPRRLDLMFDDVEVAEANDPEAMIQFANDLRGVEGIVLCHCGGGMSRAPAAALICLSVWRGPGSEAECVADVLRLRRGAVPHAGLVRFADDLLRRESKLFGELCAARATG